MKLETTVVVILLLVVVAIAVVPLVRWIVDHWPGAERPLPPIFFPMTPGPNDIEVAEPSRPIQTPVPVTRVAPAPAPPAPAKHASFAPPPPAVPASPRAAVEEPPEDTHTVRFVRAVDEPVQLLPGRLEVLAGDTRLHEIRFVRIPGEPLELILGRDAGPSPQYVGLGSSTVSRRHARFAFTDGRWVVTNLSRTNPLVVNDDELSNTGGERTLAEGDRLELGDVVLRFHAH